MWRYAELDSPGVLYIENITYVKKIDGRHLGAARTDGKDHGLVSASWTGYLTLSVILFREFNHFIVLIRRELVFKE